MLCSLMFAELFCAQALSRSAPSAVIIKCFISLYKNDGAKIRTLLIISYTSNLGIVTNISEFAFLGVFFERRNQIPIHRNISGVSNAVSNPLMMSPTDE